LVGVPELSIHEAAARGDMETVQSWLAQDPGLADADDEHGWRPIFHASLWRRLPVVRLLLKAGADVAAHDGYVLHYAGEVPNNKEIVALLVQAGALDAHVRPVDDLSRQFFAALFVGDTDRVAALLARHAPLATTLDGRGDQPIHHAARNGDTDIVRLLIQHSADVNVQNPRGHTVLYCAGGHGHLQTLHLLLDHGANPSTKFTTDGKTLLEWLAQYPDDPRFTPVAEALRIRGG
jgi:ankyrin repeat protein